MRAFQIDLNEAPDLFPVLAALAAFAKKPSTLKGIGRLIHKESNRALAIQSAWEKLGIPVCLDVESDTMTIHPWAKEDHARTVRLDPQGDHRMVMAMSILGLAGKGFIEITHAECVAKSYPEFFDDLETLGVNLSIISQ